MRPPRVGYKPPGPAAALAFLPASPPPPPPATPRAASGMTTAMRVPSRYRAQRLYLLNTNLTMELVNMMDLLIKMVRERRWRAKSLSLRGPGKGCARVVGGDYVLRALVLPSAVHEA